ncbi:MAG: flagellin [Lachnospiraceae bacterium]|nr:flagellin [Lachnospiraceae bacterium]
MRVNYNVSAMVAQNALANNDKRVNDSLGRLSSGLKIVGAKDNPSGLAMSRRMNAQIKSMQKANDSSSDGINIIRTADGVLGEIHEMLQRMNELAVRASTATLQDVDRQYIQDEITNLKQEIQRVSDTTQFNGQNLLDGTFDRRGYAVPRGMQTDPAIKVATFSEQMETGKITISSFSISERTGVDLRNGAFDDNAHQLDPDSLPANLSTILILDENWNNVFKSDMSVEVKGDQVTFKDSTGKSLTMQFDRSIDESETIEVEITDIGALTMQIGANEGQTLDIKIPAVNLTNLGIRFTDVTTEKWAKEAIGEIEGAIDFLTRLRSNLGAYQNRLEHTVSNLDVNEENLTAAYSRIVDVDMAQEMTEYSTMQVLTQSGISMLAQANQRPSELLQLLQ